MKFASLPNKKARPPRNAGLRKSACWHHGSHRDRRLDPGTPFWFCMVLPSLLDHQTRGKGKRFAREIVDRLDAATARSGGNARSPRTGRGGQGIPCRTLSHTSACRLITFPDAFVRFAQCAFRENIGQKRPDGGLLCKFLCMQLAGNAADPGFSGVFCYANCYAGFYAGGFATQDSDARIHARLQGS